MVLQIEQKISLVSKYKNTINKLIKKTPKESIDTDFDNSVSKKELSTFIYANRHNLSIPKGQIVPTIYALTTTMYFNNQKNIASLDLSYHNLQGEKLENLDLKDAKIHHTNFKGSGLFSCDLSGADIQNSDFTNALIIKTSFDSANIENTSLKLVTIGKSNFINTIFNNASSDGAVIANSTFNEGNRNNKFFDSARFHANTLKTETNTTDIAKIILNK
jgi:uncharacterized protein YjbI with pentapeptide repeats